MRGELKEIARQFCFGLMMGLGTWLTLQKIGASFTLCIIASFIASLIGVSVASWAFEKEEK